MGTEKVVTIFGSSRAKSDSNTYKLAYQLGKLLAEAGFVVCNGGYNMGVMEASSKAAKESGGKTIGITTQAFKQRSVSSWIDEEIQTESYVERLERLIRIADAIVVLKGGVGTLSEVALAWCLAVIGEMRKPIVLVGSAWQKTIADLKKHLVIDYHETQLLSTVKTPEDAVKLLEEWIL